MKVPFLTSNIFSISNGSESYSLRTSTKITIIVLSLLTGPLFLISLFILSYLARTDLFSKKVEIVNQKVPTQSTGLYSSKWVEALGLEEQRAKFSSQSPEHYNAFGHALCNLPNKPKYPYIVLVNLPRDGSSRSHSTLNFDSSDSNLRYLGFTTDPNKDTKTFVDKTNCILLAYSTSGGEKENWEEALEKNFPCSYYFLTKKEYQDIVYHHRVSPSLQDAISEV